jgi:hypothetical protein
VLWMTASECPRRMPQASSAGAEGSMRAAKKEVSTVTNRRSVDLAVLHACARARRRATPQPPEWRVGGATAPGVRAQKARSRALYAEGHPPKEGGAVPRIWFE